MLSYTKFGLVPILLLILVSCNNNSDSLFEQTPLQPTAEKSVSFTPCELGEFHNTALDHIASDVPDSESGDAIEGMNFMIGSYERSVYSNFNRSDATLLMANIPSSGDLLYYADSDFRQNVNQEVFLVLDQLLAKNLITSDMHAILEGIMQNADNTTELKTLQSHWNKIATGHSNDGFISFVFCLAYDSNYYWDNYDGRHGPIVKITPVQFDIGGAIVGTGISLLRGNDLSNSIANGVVTAVIASSGVFGRIGRWLMK